MAKYSFEVEDWPIEPDIQGVELADLAAVRAAALRFAGRWLIDHADSFWERDACRMIVRDDRGLMLMLLDVVATEAPSIEIVQPGNRV